MTETEKLARELRNRNYAENTIRTYTHRFDQFYRFAVEHQYEPEERIAAFLDTLKGPTARSHAWAAIKAYYDFVLKKQAPYHLERVKKKKRLPLVLNRDEVMRILDCINNEKHRTMIAMLYGSGLRVSELVNLRVKCLDFPTSTLHIFNSKHHKDRITLLSGKLAPFLASIISDKKAEDVLFTSLYGKKYAIRTVQEIFSKALLASGLKKKATCHTLRHSFATHLVENGVPVSRIKSLLGHKSLKTTTLYIHLADVRLSDVKSPL